MKILRGNKIEHINTEGFRSICKSFVNTTIDIGTGDGSFLYRRASKNIANFYIGLDTAAENMMKSAVKSNRKASKGGISNVMYVVGNALDVPEELSNTADSMFINLPWGSLRDAVVKGEEELLNGINNISKDKATLDIYVTYSTLYEAREMSTRQLPQLSLEYINTDLKHKYRMCGIEIKKVELCSNEILKGLDTLWAKKLAFGRPREVYHIRGIVRTKNYR